MQGLVWSASGGLLALLLARHIPEEQPLIFPAISAFLTALTGLLFQLVLRDTVPVPVYFLRIVLAAGAGLLFPVALGRRTAVTDWLVVHLDEKKAKARQARWQLAALSPPRCLEGWGWIWRR